MKKAILFDADGVVLAGKAQRFSDRYAAEFGIDPAKMKPFFENEFIECEAGRADLKEELAKYLPDWGWEGSVEELMKYWFEGDNGLDERMAEVIRKSRARGIKCYLISDQEKYRAKYLGEEVGLEDLFDGLFISYKLGHFKEEPDFYRIVLDRLGLEPDEVLMWDDGEEKVAAAKSVGIKARFWRGFEEFKEELAVDLGISD